MPSVKKPAKRKSPEKKAGKTKAQTHENPAVAILMAAGRGILALFAACGRGIANMLRFINARPRLRLASITLLIVTIAVPSWVLADRAGYVDQAAAAIDREVHDGLIATGFRVEDITVTGRVRTGKEDLLNAIGVGRGQSIMHVDLAAVRHQLSALDWVADVKVGRHLPDRLHVELTEREPFAVWQKDGRLTLIDRAGTVITSADVRSFDHLPLVVGRGANEQAARLYDRVLTRNELSHRVEAAIRVGARRWDLRLDNGIEVRLPADDPRAAWERLVDLEADHQILTRDIEVIDLRLPDRLVVRLTDEAAQRRMEPGEET